MTSIPTPFSADGYLSRVVKQVPGVRDLHRMAGLLLSETVPDDGCILALGAGGGMELRALREQQPNWSFAAVDPSAEMIEQAEKTLDGDLNQIAFTHGYIEDAPEGPFDGAICLLVLHFLEPDERLQTLKGLRRRLRPGAPLVVAHHSFPQENGGQDRWLKRYAALQIARGLDPARTQSGIANMKEKLPAIAPSKDETILRDAGFERTELFFAAFTFKGWVTYAKAT